MLQDPNDWLWQHTEEPHRSRRRAILKDHPEVAKLMGYEPLTKYVVLLVVSIQLFTAYCLRDTSPLGWRFLAVAYLVGGTCNQNLFLAVNSSLRYIVRETRLMVHGDRSTRLRIISLSKASSRTDSLQCSQTYQLAFPTL